MSGEGAAAAPAAPQGGDGAAVEVPESGVGTVAPGARRKPDFRMDPNVRKKQPDTQRLPTGVERRKDGQKAPKPSNQGVDGGGDGEGKAKASTPEPRDPGGKTVATEPQKDDKDAGDAEGKEPKKKPDGEAADGDRESDQGDDPKGKGKKPEADDREELDEESTITVEALEGDEEFAEDEDVSIDQLKKGWRLARKADRFIKAAKARLAEVEATEKAWTEDTGRQLLRMFTAEQGGDHRKGVEALWSWAEGITKERDAYLKMTPERRQAWELDQENRRLRAQLDERVQSEEKRAAAEKKAARARQVLAASNEAMKSVGLEVNDFNRDKFLRTVEALHNAGYKIDLPRIAQMVKKELSAGRPKVVQSVTADEISSLRPDLVEELNRRSVEKHKRPRGAPVLSGEPRRDDEEEPKPRRRVGGLYQ